MKVDDNAALRIIVRITGADADQTPSSRKSSNVTELEKPLLSKSPSHGQKLRTTLSMFDP